MRKYCLDCVIKHLGQASVLQMECVLGYPEHAIMIIGHLSEASEECYGVSPELSEEIRQWRLLFIKDNKTDIPFFELYKKVLQLINEKGCGDCSKASDDFKKRLKEAKS